MRSRLPSLAGLQTHRHRSHHELSPAASVGTKAYLCHNQTAAGCIAELSFPGRHCSQSWWEQRSRGCRD